MCLPSPPWCSSSHSPKWEVWNSSILSDPLWSIYCRYRACLFIKDNMGTRTLKLIFAFSIPSFHSFSQVRWSFSPSILLSCLCSPLTWGEFSLPRHLQSRALDSKYIQPDNNCHSAISKCNTSSGKHCWELNDLISMWLKSWGFQLAIFHVLLCQFVIKKALFLPIAYCLEMNSRNITAKLWSAMLRST